MSLFQFGFSLRREEPSPEDSVEVEILESHIPRQEDTNLGVVEHREIAAAETWAITVPSRAGQQTDRIFKKPQVQRWCSERQRRFSCCESTD